MKTYKNLILGGANLSIFTYIGSLYILEQNNLLTTIENYYTTSFTSILILLLNLEYTIDEIFKLYNDIELINILDINNYDILNIITNYGLYNGNYIENKIQYILESKNYNKNITLLELYNITNKSLNIVCINLSNSLEELINYKLYPNMEVYKLIKIGLTIPFFIIPFKYNNNIYISGLILNNFPSNYCNINESLAFITNNIKIHTYNNIIEYIILIIYNLIQLKYKIHNNIIQYNVTNDLNIFITLEEKLTDYNYGLKIMKEYIEHNNNDN